MKNFFVQWLVNHQEQEKRVINSDLNRDRLIRFSQRLKESSADVVVHDYSVNDDNRVQPHHSSNATVD